VTRKYGSLINALYEYLILAGIDNFTVILKFMRQFKFAKCQKSKCQETSKGTLDKIANAPFNISLIILQMNATKNDKYNILIFYYNTENKTSVVANLFTGCFDYCL
jgi:hypothetical protein